jgi:uncharacterized protein involved in type VI secretion and phage assembly
MRELLGKFRGEVVDNNPDDRGRIQVKVPTVAGDNTLSPAMPCVPYGGPGVGLFAIPPVGAKVWIEFEGGDPDYPIWTGCFWSGEENDVPPEPGTAEAKVFKTDVGMITLNDTSGSGGITIETKDGMKIVMNSNGIEITTGQGRIKLTGNQVSVNDGALEVT